MILKGTSLALPLAVAVFMLAAAAALKYAQGLEIIGPDVATRSKQVMVGLILAIFVHQRPAYRGSAPHNAKAKSDHCSSCEIRDSATSRNERPTTANAAFSAC